MIEFPEHGGNLAWARKKYKREDFLDFSANINPLGCPQGIYDAIKNSLPLIKHYPDPESNELKSSLQTYFGLEKELILLGNGAVEIIYSICCYLKPKKVLILAPTFSEYTKAAKAVEAEARYLPLEASSNFTLDLEILEEYLRDIDIFFLCNPNNPVGNILEYATLNKIQELCLKNDVFLVVDESFIDFVPKHEKYSVRKDLKHNHKLLVLHSLTKFFAIPGLRLGCGLANPQLVASLEKLKDPWNINLFAQVAGKVALEDRMFQRKSIEFIIKEKEFLFNSINKISKYYAYTPAVNFIMIRLLEPNLDSTKVTSLMAEKGILVRNCNTFPTLGDKFIRVAVRTREENLKLISALEEISV